MIQHPTLLQGEQLQRQSYNDSKRRRQQPTTNTYTASSSVFASLFFQSIPPPKRRKVYDNKKNFSDKANCDFYEHPLAHFSLSDDDSKINTENVLPNHQAYNRCSRSMTNPPNSASLDPPSTSSHVRQEEIDQLRSRVDSVLKNLVQSSEVDSQNLQTQVQSLRSSGSHDRNGAFVLSPANNGSLSRGSSDNSDGGANRNPVTASVTREAISKYVEQQWIVDPYGDQGDFEGEINAADNLPHGTGVMKYSDGRVYAGEWKGGRWHGKGRATFSNGDVFEGMYYEDQRHGLGTYQWADGREFKGGFVNDQRSGHGDYTWPDGAKYSGEFQKGLRHGEGTYTFSDGSFYRGSWKNGKYHGKGECFWSDGRVYKGDWENGKAHGYGKEIRPDGSIRHDGKWENDKPVRDP